MNVLNQFGDQTLDLIRRMEVCVPALAVPPELLQFEEP